LRRAYEMAGPAPFTAPGDVRRIIDNYQYLDDWRANYRIQSVRSSLRNTRITCIDAAILSYGLLEMLFPDTKRRLLAIHRRDPKKDEGTDPAGPFAQAARAHARTALDLKHIFASDAA